MVNCGVNLLKSGIPEDGGYSQDPDGWMVGCQENSKGVLRGRHWRLADVRINIIKMRLRDVKGKPAKAEMSLRRLHRGGGTYIVSWITVQPDGDSCVVLGGRHDGDELRLSIEPGIRRYRVRRVILTDQR